MAKDFREQFGEAAKKLGLESNPNLTEDAPKLEKSKKIELYDRVRLKEGFGAIDQYRNPGGSLRKPTIGDRVRMGYRDADSGFIVKSFVNLDVYGKVAEIEPVKYSYKKDQGATYLAELESLEK